MKWEAITVVMHLITKLRPRQPSHLQSKMWPSLITMRQDSTEGICRTVKAQTKSITIMKTQKRDTLREGPAERGPQAAKEAEE